MSLDSNNLNDMAALGKQIYDALPEEAKNSLFIPPAKSIGNGVGNLVDLFFYPINYANILANGKLKEIQNKTNQKIEKKKEAGVYSQNKIGLAAKAIEESKYQLDSEILQDYFSELIANSLDKNYEDKISPYFATLLSNLSETDALFLRKAKNFIVQIKSPLKAIASKKIKIPISRFKMDNTLGGADLTETKIIWSPNEIESANATVSSLISFGLIKENWETWLTSEKYKKYYDSHQLTSDYHESVEFVEIFNITQEENYELVQEKGFIEFTDLGILFLETVVV
ncbi:Abi-alpha family protein [Enterococcus faecalis]|uniref:Abi-alpha family protein n=1 Tax=Enterococcus TaxID=1350 RepID=UPI00053BF783|nr:Abi-alpha family protein [Enterococcus faecalis]EHQ8839928.1 DUF4393 domain-containing protein [Enterococcus faecalis]KII54386.1 hypothetical protein QR19_03860 [Enterococcus faecalis]MDN3112421.1 Abi-alpha family protein [Enterococcus faecalis]HBI2038617.1 DUF4393 domain-containing protein [Enterococcus faecalis]HBI2080490.1 DUF4393 domain-containing protein [Enterococcus faecalis]